MDLTREDIAHALADAGLYTFPREVFAMIPGVPEAKPERKPVPNPGSFIAWWDMNHGLAGKTTPMFIGHNAHVQPEKFSVSAWRHPSQYIFETAFGDFDTGDGSGLKPPEVWTEVRKTSEFLILNRLEHYWKYSGSDCGFHLRVFFQKESQPRSYLDRWESAFWRGLKHELAIRSINIKCANPVCLERIPYSRYVHKKDPEHPGDYIPEANFCVPVPWELIRDDKLDRIRELSQYPELFDTVRFPGDRPLPTLEGFVRRKGWETFGHEVSAFHPEPTYEVTGDIAERIKLYIPNRRCLQVLPFGPNPRHPVRFGLLCQLLALDMGLEETVATIEAVGREARWEDFNPEKIREAVYHGIKRGYSSESCKTLRRDGVCLGASCVLFRDAFPEEWGEYRLRHPEAV